MPSLKDLAGAALIGLAILLTGVVAATVGRLFDERTFAPAGGSEALSEDVAELGRRLADLTERLETESRKRRALEAEIARLAARPAADEAPTEATAGDLTDPLELTRGRFNEGLSTPRRSYLRVLLGEPRGDYSQACQPPTNPRLIGLLERRDVGPFEVTMVTPALDSLERVLDRLKRQEPDIYRRLGTAGALCVRYIRGSSSAVSNHAWGLAIDITVAGELDRLGDGGTQFALVVLAEFFNAEQWFWGAEYSREDSMHFEVSEELLRRWVEQGLL